MTLSASESIVSRDCVVCGQDADDPSGDRGDRLLVFHHNPAAHACGYLIHENCRYRDNAPVCPCHAGRAEEGLTPRAVGSLTYADSAPDAHVHPGFDEPVPPEGLDD